MQPEINVHFKLRCPIIPIVHVLSLIFQSVVVMRLAQLMEQIVVHLVENASVFPGCEADSVTSVAPDTSISQAQDVHVSKT